MPDDPAIISDDPNVVPMQNNAALAAPSTPGDIQQAPAIDDSSQVSPDTVQNWVNNPAFVGSDNTYGPQASQPGSNSDAVVQALKMGHSWDEISQYLGEKQQDGGLDKLVEKIAPARPSLGAIWYQGPN